MKRLFPLLLFSVLLSHRPAAQSASFSDTLDMITRSWKLASAEGPKDLPIHLEKEVGSTVSFRKDFTYISRVGDSVTEHGIWAIDREKKWLMSVPDKKTSFIARIEKLGPDEWKLSFDINDEKIWLTMIPSDHN